MIDMREELFAVPEYEWRHVPFMASRHKWWLRWYRGDDGGFCFAFVSPKKRSYSFFVERGKDGGRVTDAAVALANGEAIASYWQGWCDTPERLDAVIRLTPKHIIDRLHLLLSAIG